MMWRIYECVAIEHEFRSLVLALVLCFFASSTAVIMGQRALAATDSRRLRWLLAAGAITGLGIWTTHFAAMLAFEPGVSILFDVRYTVGALACAIAFSIAGWAVAFWRDRGNVMLGGALIGVGLTGAHFLDTFGLRFAGTITLDADLVLLSVPLGVSLCAVAAYLLARHQRSSIPILASVALAAGIFSLHITAMSAVTLLPDPRLAAPGEGLGPNTLGGWVIAGAISILAAGFALGVHDQYSAGIHAHQRQQLDSSLDELRQLQEHYRSTLELNPQIPWTTDATGHCLEIGPRWTEYIGLSREAAMGSGWLSVIHPEDARKAEALWVDAIHTGKPFDARYRFRCRDGSYRWFRDRGWPRRHGDGTIAKWYGSVEDIHEQVVAEDALRSSEERYRLASRATSDAIWDWSHASEKIDWGGAIGSHFGYHEAVAGTSFNWWSDRVHADDRKRVLGSLRTVIAGNDSHWAEEYRFRKANGTYAHILSRGSIVRDEHGQAVRSVGAMIDISELKRIEASLRWAAHHDPLTDLPNRTLFEQRLAEALADAERQQREVGLVVLDVDQFKMFNDSRGHQAGDKLLCWIARKLEEGQRRDATVARLGGDEFAIILPGYKKSETDTLLANLSEPFQFQHETVDVGVSAGLAVWPADAKRLDELIICADLALYACKAERRQGVRRFRPEMRRVADERARMLEMASVALRDERMFPYYQPKVCLKTGTVVGMEALLRWQHPILGIQSPSTIEEAFDNAELATKITDRVVDCVLADIRHWHDQGLDFGRVAINATAADFMRGDFDKRLLCKLEQAGISPRYLELELTENVLVGRDPARVDATLREFKRAGMTIALDDFGTGYASLSHLNAFPVDVLKIDQSFVQQLSTGHRGDEAIVRAVIGLARNIRLLTVAEGVETREQALRLQELKCDQAQGYLFSRPVPAQEVPSALMQGMLQWDVTARSSAARRRAVG